MEHAIGEAEALRDGDTAIDLASRWSAAVPCDDTAHLRLIALLRTHRTASTSLDCHRDFVARIRQSLRLEPSPELVQLGLTLQDEARLDRLRNTRRSSALRTPALVGRELELTELHAAWRAAKSGEPRVVLVEDAGGGGKSRLLEEFAKSLSNCGDRVFVLRASGRMQDKPYDTARRLFAPLGLAPGSLGAAGQALRETARLVPALAQVLPDLEGPTDSSYALRDALVEVLAAVSEEQPILIGLDDAHFADAESRELLVSIATHLTGPIVMLLLADEGAREPRTALTPLLAINNLARIRLRPLSLADVERMIGSMLRVREVHRERLAVQLHLESFGTPFLVYEFLVALVQDQILELDAFGEWHLGPRSNRAPLPLPAAVRERIAPSLASLSFAARTLLESIAVLRTPVDCVLLERCSGLSPMDASRAVRELVTLHLVTERVEAGQIDLTHPILGRIAYALLSPSERLARQQRAVQELARVRVIT